MCCLLGIKRSGYYRYAKFLRSKTVIEDDEKLLELIREIAEGSRHSYGSRRMRKALNACGYPFGRSKTKRLIKEAGVYARYRKKYKVTTNSNHKLPLFQNILKRGFKVEAPDTVYASDITYIHTQEGWGGFKSEVHNNLSSQKSHVFRH